METEAKPRFSINKFPRKMVIGIQDGYCNLKCPKCFIHSPDRKINMKGLRGKMPLKNLCEILDEIDGSGIQITTNRWSEPLIIKDFPEYVTAIKKRGLPVIINTNGLLLTRDFANFFVDIGLDSIFFSIDATTKETLKKVRGVYNLDEIKNAVFLMLEARGGSNLPRIGTSFVVGQDNKDEKDEFVSYWLKYVDVIRVNPEYSFDKKMHGLGLLKERIPCHYLYDIMAVDYKGDVCLCCLDALVEIKMGNVFEEGIEKVWNGKKLAKVRYYHDTGQYDKIPFCKDCNMWAEMEFEESVVDGVLVRRSPIMTFYNPMARLHNWKVKQPQNVRVD